MSPTSQFDCGTCGESHQKQAFISHASKDEEIKEKLARACCDGGVAPFLFEFRPEFYTPTIPGDFLADQVYNSDVILVLLGPNVSKFWTQAWMGFEVGVSMGADVATGREIYNRYFSKKIIVIQDIHQGNDAAVPRLDALLLFDFNSGEGWNTLQQSIDALINKYVGEPVVRDWPYQQTDISEDLDFIDDFSDLNSLRQKVILDKCVKCGNCKSQYDVWMLLDDAESPDLGVRWIMRGYRIIATHFVDCPSCDKKNLCILEPGLYG